MDLPSVDVRWEQRFQNFSRAFKLLREAVEDKDIEQLSQLEQEGVIQRFEYTFELAWKTLKDYLEYSGVEFRDKTPRGVIKECNGCGIFAEAGIDGDIYLNMMLARNLLSHTYDFETFREIISELKALYYPQLEKQYLFLLKKSIPSLGR